MNRPVSIRGLVLFCCGALAPASLVAQADITGEWELKMDRNGRESFATLAIAKKADGALAGKWSSNELSDVKFDGQKLTFARTMRFGDQSFTLNYEGTVKDGVLTGTLSSERGSFPASGGRKKARNPAIGRWDVRFKIEDRDIEGALAISEATGGSLDAKWTSSTGEHTVSSVKFDAGKLTFARKSKIGEREFESTYEGTIKGDKLEGAIKGQFGEIPANGDRFGAALIGSWELTSSSDRGPRTSLLHVFGDLTGRYESFGGEIPFKDLKLEGEQVSFSIEAGFGDQVSTVSFKGKLDGKTLKGEVTSTRGTREVTGKKLEPAAPSPFVGAWEITREGRNGPRTELLNVRADLTATYTSGENTLAVTELRVEGDQLSFKVTMKRADREVPMEFKGKIEGGAFKGQVTTARGTREITGKKKVTESL